ncbi:MAG: TRAP transporter small permease [Deltaproteobacteria bacterium]|nr:TRAP transporter small permease [Deltaproteobacteria bacterium]
MKIGMMYDKFLGGLAFVSGILLVLACSGVGIMILSRYFLNRPMGWMIEIAEYILLHIAFLLAAWVLSRDAHVKMDVVVEFLNPKIRLVCNVASSILGAIVCLVLVWFGTKVTLHLYQSGTLTTTYLEIPKFPLAIVIPFGSLLFLIQFVRRAYGFLKAGREPEAEK